MCRSTSLPCAECPYILRSSGTLQCVILHQGVGHLCCPGGRHQVAGTLLSPARGVHLVFLIIPGSGSCPRKLCSFKVRGWVVSVTLFFWLGGSEFGRRCTHVPGSLSHVSPGQQLTRQAGCFGGDFGKVQLGSLWCWPGGAHGPPFPHAPRSLVPRAGKTTCLSETQDSWSTLKNSGVSDSTC